MRDTRMAAGPAHLLRSGLLERLRRAGHTVELHTVDVGAGPLLEVANAFTLARAIAGRVQHAVAQAQLPIVLAGNCNSALGTVAGLDATNTAILWFDAHGDLNTPETSTSGFLDGMSLATLTGRCWKPLADTIPGFTRSEERRVGKECRSGWSPYR